MSPAERRHLVHTLNAAIRRERAAGYPTGQLEAARDQHVAQLR